MWRGPDQDQRIAHTSYHALSQRERAVHEARGQLLRLMAALLRQTAGRGGAGERTPPAGQYIEPYPRRWRAVCQYIEPYPRRWRAVWGLLGLVLACMRFMFLHVFGCEFVCWDMCLFVWM